MWRRRATYRWKSFNEGYNFASNLITIGGLHRKLCAPKVARIPIVGISGLPLGSPETKNHLDVTPMERHKIYYRGEGGGFPQVRAVANLVCPNCLWFILTPKVFQLCTNYFVLVFCKPVWSFSLLPSPISELQHAPLPFYSVASQGATLTPCSFVVFSLGLTFESLKELGACQSGIESLINGKNSLKRKLVIHTFVYIAIHVPGLHYWM